MSSLIIKYLGLGFILFSFGLYYNYTKGTFKLTKTSLLILFLYILIVIHYLIVGLSLDSENSLNLLFGFVLFSALTLMSNVIDSSILFYWMNRILLFTSVIYVLVNFVAYILFKDRLTIEGNFTGIASNPNMLGSYVAIIGVPLYLKGIKLRLELRFLFIFLIILISFFVVYKTQSRASLLVLFSISAFAFRKFIIKHWVLSIFFLVLIFVFLFPLIVNKYEGQEVFGTRKYLYSLRLDAISERPYFGWGINYKGSNTYDEYNVFPPLEKGNTLLQILEDLGIILGGIFILLMGYVIYSAVLRLSKIPNLEPFALILIGSVVHLMFETWLFSFSSILSIIFWSIIFWQRRRCVSSTELDYLNI